MSREEFSYPNLVVHLRAGGVSVLVDLKDGQMPSIAYWGEALPQITRSEALNIIQANIAPVVNNTVDQTVRLALLPEQFTGWTGRPGVSGSRSGADWSPKFRTHKVAVDSPELQVDENNTVDGDATFVSATDGSAHVFALDEQSKLGILVEIELAKSGLMRARATLQNHGHPYQLNDLILAFPIPTRAREILDFAGHWALERVPQRRELGVGIHLREGRKGRTGADAVTILSVGVPSFTFGNGEVWGLHVGFSGNHVHFAERLFSGAQVVGGGELLLPGEIQLGYGEEYVSPWIYAAYGDGLDAQAQTFHRYLRGRPNHPHSPRPVTINVWEAVYFDHNLERLIDLANRASLVGAERFVLDDGWFRGRRDDTSGLGDWFVDEVVWPDGLGPLVKHVKSKNMEFGLWFEPEMVNENSEVAREHPEWIMQTGGRLPVRSRYQQVLNLGLAPAFDYVLERISSVVQEYGVDYIKWDHNRDLIDAGTTPTGIPGVHSQTLAVYRLMDELRARFPGLEIESCSSGGARVDLGIIERTDRVWVSDCIDPLDRQSMNRWTQQLLPPELLGSHIASARSHTTGRVHELSFRAATALFGHLGIEWDLAEATEAELSELTEWVQLYKSTRGLLHSGDLVRMDEADPSVWVAGVVAGDRRQALFSLVFMGRSVVSPRGSFQLRGLDPNTQYRVKPIMIGHRESGFAAPNWYTSVPDPSDRDTVYPGTVLSGKVLGTAGLQAPESFPENAIVLAVSACASRRQHA